MIGWNSSIISLIRMWSWDTLPCYNSVTLASTPSHFFRSKFQSEYCWPLFWVGTFRRRGRVEGCSVDRRRCLSTVWTLVRDQSGRRTDPGELDRLESSTTVSCAKQDNYSTHTHSLHAACLFQTVNLQKSASVYRAIRATFVDVIFGKKIKPGCIV